MSVSGRESLSDNQKWSGGPPECPGVVEMPSRMSVSDRETLPNVREALPDVRKSPKTPSDVQEWSGGPPRC